MICDQFSGVFQKIKFYEKRDGGIRLTFKITPILAETISLRSEMIESVIEQVKSILLDDRSKKKISQLVIDKNIPT
jgi:hypothetical protein